jgi:hypothetical protein
MTEEINDIDMNNTTESTGLWIKERTDIKHLEEKENDVRYMCMIKKTKEASQL